MKRLLALLLSIVLASTVLGGCGTSGKNLSESEGEKGGSVQQVTVKVFHHMSEEGKRKAFQKWADHVEKEIPGTKFDIQAIDESQYSTMLKTKIAADDAPDVIFGLASDNKDLIGEGHILDLSGQPFLNNLSKTAVDSMTVNGKVYGMGVDLGVMGAFYNKNLFEEAGLEVPKTYSDFIKVCDTFKSKNISPMSHGFKDSWVAQVDFQSDFYSTLKKQPTFFDDISENRKKFSDFPEFKKCLERYAKRLSYSSGDDFGTDYSKSIQLFATGKTAMILQGSWAIAEIRADNLQGNFGFFVIPSYEDPEDNFLNVGLDDAFMVSSTTRVKEPILKLFEYASSSKGASEWVKDTNTISCVKDIKTDNADPMIADIMTYINSNQIINTATYNEFSGQKGSVWLQYQEMFATDHNNIDQFIDKLQKEFDSIS